MISIIIIIFQCDMWVSAKSRKSAKVQQCFDGASPNKPSWWAQFWLAEPEKMADIANQIIYPFVDFFT